MVWPPRQRNDRRSTQRLRKGPPAFPTARRGRTAWAALDRWSDEQVSGEVLLDRAPISFLSLAIKALYGFFPQRPVLKLLGWANASALSFAELPNFVDVKI